MVPETPAEEKPEGEDAGSPAPASDDSGPDAAPDLVDAEAPDSADDDGKTDREPAEQAAG
jgi:hypothetical protein